MHQESTTPVAGQQPPTSVDRPSSVDLMMANGNSPNSDTADMLAWAEMMADHSFLPDHLRFALKRNVTVANCFRIVAQARTWRLDPFTVAEQSSLCRGRIMYSGVIVAAVLQNSGKLTGRLTHLEEGEGDDMLCTVSGIMKGTKESLTHTLRLGDVATKDSRGQRNPAWVVDSRNLLWYRTVRAWAKLFLPEVLIGCGEDPDSANNPQESTNAPWAQATEPAPPPKFDPLDKCDPVPEESVTLQQALATLPDAAALIAAGAKIMDNDSLPSLISARNRYFALVGLGDDDDNTVSRIRMSAWHAMLAKRGVRPLDTPPPEVARELTATLEQKMAELVAARQANGTTCAAKEAPPAVAERKS